MLEKHKIMLSYDLDDESIRKLLRFIVGESDRNNITEVFLDSNQIKEITSVTDYF